MYDFIDESFNRNYLYENKLSIQVGLNGFSFCIQQADDNKILLFQEPQFVLSGFHLLARRFKEWCSEEELLKVPYKSREIVINSRNFALIPEQLESENLKKTISELLPEGRETEYAEGWIKSVKAKLVYHLPPGFAKTVVESIGESRLIHPVQKLIGVQKRTEQADSILLFFDEKDMYLVLKKDHELALCNIFRINHANDAIYFILSVLHQFDIRNKSVNVLTGGKASYLNELKSMLSKYFPFIGLLRPQAPESAAIPEEVLSKNVCLF